MCRANLNAGHSFELIRRQERSCDLGHNELSFKLMFDAVKKLPPASEYCVGSGVGLILIEIF